MFLVYAKRGDPMAKPYFKIKEVKDGYVVYRVGNNKEKHSHICSEDTCYALIRMIQRGVMPHSQYLIESCRYLLSKKEFRRLKPDPKYFGDKDYTWDQFYYGDVFQKSS